jgi:hypothetical protein
MAAAVRRRKLIGHRRRVEDEGEDEGGPDHLEFDDDSLSDGSLASDDVDAADDSDTSNVEDTSPTAPPVKKIPGRTASTNGNRKARSKPSGSAAVPKHSKSSNDVVSDTQFMLNGLSLSDKTAPVQEVEFDDAVKSPPKAPAPIVVSSNSVSASGGDGSQGPIGDRRRNEHEEYRRKRDEDPSFVPNRGSFFMHDHRHAGPSANGFRPFGRASRGRGRGIGGPFAPAK